MADLHLDQQLELVAPPTDQESDAQTAQHVGQVGVVVVDSQQPGQLPDGGGDGEEAERLQHLAGAPVELPPAGVEARRPHRPGGQLDEGLGRRVG